MAYRDRNNFLTLKTHSINTDVVTFGDVHFYNPNRNFDVQALALFREQFEQNPTYRSFCDLLNKTPAETESISKIPFLPISFFKTHQVTTGPKKHTHAFVSSGTGGNQSTHYVQDIGLYEESFLTAFEQFYGSADQYAVIGLLPGYLERPDSSLIYMVQRLIESSNDSDSGFYLDQHKELHDVLLEREAANKKTLLIGVSFALLDFADAYPCQVPSTIVMETGGMKGRRKELLREELHTILKQRLGVDQIHSEYGMTELLSQAYAPKNGVFFPPPWMRVLVRNPHDPLDVKQNGKGCLNIIDLANRNSCAFIATDDLGEVHADGSFEVLGRYDAADVRGCNLMVS